MSKNILALIRQKQHTKRIQKLVVTVVGVVLSLAARVLFRRQGVWG